MLQARRKVLATILAIWGVAATAEEVDLLAFGDSLTAGYGLIETEGFVPQLRDWLAAQGHEVRVVNAGVSGDTTAGGAARIGWSLTPEIDAMILTLGGNDLLRGIDPAVTRANLDTILSEAEAHGVSVLVVGLRAPDNYGPEYKTAFDAIYPDLAEDYGALYEPSFFAGLGEDDPREARQYFQPDGIHPNADGVRRIIEALGPRVIGLITGAE
ncbi:acyl-CoA thioesterase-1 [Poseidonocella pacifica]|uniref:Acyl-CoA thioesterase-1 n=1 Tax=Poseidonocella pacifica TaxID=871651 RepID=A0A1I0V532_9RHOB|nr:acyl-CoA thioesterase-1 [Poseidonocella pacifica]